MDATRRSQLVELFQERKEIIADRWYRAVARTSFVPLTAEDARCHLTGLTEQAIQVLLAERFLNHQARAIGAGLALLHYIHPDALGNTQMVLASELLAGLPDEDRATLYARLAEL